MENSHILFVDDDVRLLNGIRRRLFVNDSNWNLAFASSGKEAIEIMSRKSFDIIVSDLRMPEMDGAELLEYVQKNHPDMIRIVLSGYSSEDMTLRVVSTAHQYIAKPCQEEDIIQAVASAVRVQSLMSNKGVKHVITNLQKVPTLPDIYQKLVQTLMGDEVSMKQVGYLISQDVLMTAKILQLVNSAFFGLSQHVSNPALAVNMLGYNTILALVLTVKIYDTFTLEATKEFDLQRLFNHSIQTAQYAKKIAASEGLPQYKIDDCELAGMLHDIGRLLLIGNLPEEYSQMRKKRQEKRLSSLDAEREFFGVSHAELGGYLLGMWGMQDEIIEGVAFHHEPERGCNNYLSICDIIYYANMYDHFNKEMPVIKSQLQIRKEYLEKKGIYNKMLNWHDACEKVDERK